MSSGKINRRSNNTYAMLTDNSYVKLNYFIVDRSSKLECTIVQKLRVVNASGDQYKLFFKNRRIKQR